MLVCRLPNEQYPVVAEHRSAHAELWRCVTGLLTERHLDVPDIQTGMLGHDLRRQGMKPLITLAIVLVARESKAGLRQSLYLTRPQKPYWLGRTG